MIQINEKDVIFISGRRQFGKTTLIKELGDKIALKYPIFYVDIVHNFNEEKYIQLSGQEISFDDIVQPNQFVFKIFNKDDFYNVTKQLWELCQVVNAGKSTNPRLGTILPIFIVFDEIHIYCSDKTMDSYYCAYMRQLLFLGGNYGVGLISASQRPQSAPKDFITQANALYTFNLYHEKDLEKIQDYFNIEEVKRLPRYYFIGFYPDKVKNQTKRFSPLKI